MPNVETIVHPVRWGYAPQLRIQVGPTFEDDTVTFRSGQMQTNVDWDYPLWDYVLQYRKRSEDLQALMGFWAARKGRGYGFFFADPIDYDDNGWGSVKLVNGVYRLVKTYPDTDDYSPFSRLITRPIEDSVDLSEVPGTGLTLDYTTGIVTGTGVGEGPATFEFDVPVKFMNNSFMPTYEPGSKGKEIGDMVDVRLRELRFWRLAD